MINGVRDRFRAAFPFILVYNLGTLREEISVIDGSAGFFPEVRTVHSSASVEQTDCGL